MRACDTLGTVAGIPSATRDGNLGEDLLVVGLAQFQPGIVLGAQPVVFTYQSVTYWNRSYGSIALLACTPWTRCEIAYSYRLA